MAKALSVEIKENLKELSQLKTKQPQHLKARVQMLILLKKSGPMTKIQLASALSVNHNTAHHWRKAYLEGGIKQLLRYERGGNKPSLISEKAHKQIEKRLNNPTGALRSYKELQQWIEEHFVPGIKYTTVNEYVKRHFGTKLKVARKSHIQKDEQAGAAFLKNREVSKTY
jgi:transposase